MIKISVKTTGCFESNVAGVPFTNFPKAELPDSFDLRQELTAPWDQGNRGICVSVCMTDTLSYVSNFFEKKYKKAVDYFYKNRSNKKLDGMTIREAFEIAVKDGFAYSYALLRNIQHIRTAIFSSGPVIACLPVYNFSKPQFWLPDLDITKPLGYHAITFVGYVPGFLILRNSWGTEWQDGGYSFFSEESIGSIKEAWALFV